MKNILLIGFLIILFTGHSKAQDNTSKIYLRATGFTGIDSTKNYIVLDYPKVTKGDLYKKTLTYLNGIYNNPGKVITAVDGESITINAYNDQISQAGNLYRFPFTYNIIMQFKDNKIRFEPRIVEMKEVFTVNNKETPFYVNSAQSPQPVEIHCIYLHNREKNTTFLFQKDLKNAIDKWINAYIAGINSALADNW